MGLIEKEESWRVETGKGSGKQLSDGRGRPEPISVRLVYSEYVDGCCQRNESDNSEDIPQCGQPRNERKACTNKCRRGSLTLLLCESPGIKKTAHFVVDIIAGSRGWFHIWEGKCDSASKSNNITPKTARLRKTMRQLVDHTTHANFPPSGPSWLSCLRSQGSFSEEHGRQKMDLHRSIDDG
jgi:hypothetical protein